MQKKIGILVLFMVVLVQWVAAQADRWQQHIDYNIKASLDVKTNICLLYTSPSPRDRQKSRMPSSA